MSGKSECGLVEKVISYILERLDKSVISLRLLREISLLDSNCIDEKSVNVVLNYSTKLLSNNIQELLYLLQIFFNLGYRDKADKIAEGIKKLLSSKKNIDSWTKTVALTCLSRYYWLIGEKKISNEMIKKAENFAARIPDKSDLSDAFRRISTSIIEFGDFYTGIKLINRIPYLARRYDAALESIDILCQQNRLKEIEEILNTLNGENRLIGLSKLAFCNFIKGNEQKAVRLCKKILMASKYVNNELFEKMIEYIIPPLLSRYSWFELEKEINNSLNNLSVQESLAIIPPNNFKTINSIKKIQLEIKLLELFDKEEDLRKKIDVLTKIIVYDIHLGKDFSEVKKKLDLFFNMLDNVNESEYVLFIQKFLRYLSKRDFREKLFCEW